MKLRGSDASERERTVIERQVTHLTRLVDDLSTSRGSREEKWSSRKRSSRLPRSSPRRSRSPVRSSSSATIHWTCTCNEGTHRQGGFHPSQPGHFQPADQCGEVHPSRRSHHDPNRAGAGEILVRVRDTGIGIAPEVLPQVFDLFVQERQAIDRSQGGLGLGLTIVRSLVERHGGTVSANSDGPGKGSEFVVRLPRASVRISGRGCSGRRSELRNSWSLARMIR